MRTEHRRNLSWDALRGELWVLPTLSIALFLVAGAVLSRVSVDPESRLGRLVFQGTAQDARELLIVVSATMITVTGLVFALTMVALQIASGQFSPRLLREFVRDRGNQVVLAVFVGTYAYSTAGLHTVGARPDGGEGFVPRLAVSGSLALGFASVGMLVYFIHHLAHSIQIDLIMAGVRRETLEATADSYPEPAGNAAADEHCPVPPRTAVALPASRSGYVQVMEPTALLDVAVAHDIVVAIVPHTGDFVVAGTPLAWAWGRPPAGGPRDVAGLTSAVNAAVVIGIERTMVQDVPFGIRRLVDIALRALSPAVNDPYTAVQSVHNLAVILSVLAGRRLGDRLYRDAAGEVRVAAPFPDFATYITLGCAQIRRFGASEPAVVGALVKLLSDVGHCTAIVDRRKDLARQLRLVLADARRETAQEEDLDAVLSDGAAALRRLD